MTTKINTVRGAIVGSSRARRQTHHRVRSSIIALGLAFTAFVVPAADAAIRYVSSSTGSDTTGDVISVPNSCLTTLAPCATIGRAVAAAAADDVLYLAGAFDEAVEITQPLSIEGRRLGSFLAPFPACVGEQCPSWTVNSGLNPAVRILLDQSTDRASIASITFQDASINAVEVVSGELMVSDTLFHRNGRGIEASSNGSLHVVDSVFTDNARQVAVRGGAIRTFGVTHIERTEFRDNIGSIGGAISAEQPATLNIVDSAFIGNSAEAGGAIFPFAAVTALIERCQFEDNRALRSGGAIWLSSNSTLRDSSFIRNVASGSGGAVTINDASSISMSGLLFQDNVAGRYGGALNIQSVFDDGTLEDIVLTGNRVELDPIETEGRGGALFVFSSNLTLNRVTIDDNSVSGVGNRPISGGGIAKVSSGTLRIHDSDIINNQLVRESGIPTGAGIASTGLLILTGTTVANNRNVFGSDPNVGAGGTGISAASGLVMIEESLITDQSDGLATGERASVRIDRSALTNNGRALSLSGSFEIVNSTLSGNATALSVRGVDSPQAIIQSTLVERDAVNATLDQSLAPTAQITLQDSIVLGRCVDVQDTATNIGRNLFSDSSCANTVIAQPLLQPLAQNGGPTPTHALLPNSAAVDSAGLRCLLEAETAIDQRGITRAADGTDCDVGAFELTLTDADALFADGFE